MSQQYTLVISELYKALGLDVPTEIEEVMSLQIGEIICHLTEQPTDNLLMFSNLGPVDNFDIQQLLKYNMFSQALLKPALGIDESSDSIILWNRQFLPNADSNTLYQQLELLSQASDNLTDRKSVV